MSLTDKEKKMRVRGLLITKNCSFRLVQFFLKLFANEVRNVIIRLCFFHGPDFKYL